MMINLRPIAVRKAEDRPNVYKEDSVCYQSTNNTCDIGYECSCVFICKRLALLVVH